MQASTRRLVYLGLLISLNIILVRIASIRLVLGGVEFMRIGFGSFPVIFAGLLFGPKNGAIVGIVGDVIGFQLSPSGPYLPQFTAIAALTGLIPGVLYQWGRQQIYFWKLAVIVLITQTITAVVLTPWLLQCVFGIPLMVTLPAKVLSLVVTVPSFAYLARILLERLPAADLRFLKI